MKPPNKQDDLSRRAFLKAGITTAVVAGLPKTSRADQPQTQPAEPKPQVPKRVLGRTGQEVSILNLGAGRRPRRRTLNAAYEFGIRYIDTAASYDRGKSEQAIGKWLNDTGRRKEFVVATKDGPSTPQEWLEMVDPRLEALQTDYLDLFFIHGLGTINVAAPYGDHGGRPWLKSKEWAKAAEEMKKSGKVRFVGFTTHSEFPMRTDLLNDAAAGGWVDAIMMSYDPQVVRENAEFDKALDACHKAGIGLVCMKEMRAVVHAPKFLPEFEKMGLTPHQAVLYGVWSDERIATVSSMMPNLRILEENATAAANFKPLDNEGLGAVLDIYKRYARSYCNNCDGRCRRAGRTNAALNEITRCLSYYECDGDQEMARQAYAALTPEQRDWHGADLAAASGACVCKLDFATLLPLAEEKLA